MRNYSKSIVTLYMELGSSSSSFT